MDKISVIVPLYKGKKYISNILKQINNNYEKVKQILEIEVIFVNDYPEEKIILNEYYGKMNNNIKLLFIENQYNMGIHESRINGLLKSSGNIIYFFDQDDYISGNYFESQYAVLQNNDVVVCNGFQKGKTRNDLIYTSNYHINKVKKLNTYKMWNEIVSPGQCLIKRQCIPNYWIENIVKNNGSDDFFLWVLLLTNNCKFVINYEKLYTHILTEYNFSNNFDKMINSNKEVCEYLKRYNQNTKKIANYQEKFIEMKIGKDFSLKENVYSFFKHPIIFLNRVIYKIIKYLKKTTN